MSTEQAFCPCEGSGAPNRGWCPMCAAVFLTDPIPPHDRVDVLTARRRTAHDVSLSVVRPAGRSLARHRRNRRRSRTTERGGP